MPATAPALPEKAHDVLRHAQRRPLEALFTPRSIALIGATDKPGSVGEALVRNLRFFDGPVHYVNPNRATLGGAETYPSVAALPQPADLAVIATPAGGVPGLVRECGEAGIPAAIIVSAGFRESGAAGTALEQQCLAAARQHHMRLLGPNCLGLMVPRAQLNATFSEAIAEPGSIAFISQSGALCSAVLDWSFRENVGFSAFASVGSMLDVGWGDLITHLGDDPFTKSIICYMESIGDARAFLSAAREVALSKPIVVLKVGRAEAGARAAVSHTGALTGNDAVLDAAFRRAGVLRVDTIAELFSMAELLGKQPRPKSPRLAIVTNAGGPGALATDALVASGGELAPLAPDTLENLEHLLPPHWSHGNPVDILGDADVRRYAEAVRLVLDDPATAGVLAILTPQAMTDAKGVAEALSGLARHSDKPVLASWMGGSSVDAGRGILNGAGVSTFDHPDAAARAFALMWRREHDLRMLFETPATVPQIGGVVHQPGQKAAQLIHSIRRQGRTLLTEPEAKQLLGCYGIPVTDTRTALSEEEAVEHAAELGFPVVVKLLSRTLTHKSAVAGVHLDLRNAGAVRHAWRDIHKSVVTGAQESDFAGVTVQPMIRRPGFEMILGSSVDPQFGPIILFGAGGVMVEVFQDRAVGLPPLNTTLALRLMEQTKIFPVWRKTFGAGAGALAALEELVVRFSQMVTEHPRIAEIEINPVLATSDGMLALDARARLHPDSVADADLPRPAIRPYPGQYVMPCKLRDGTAVTIRPIRPDDEPLMVRFHRTLSERSVYLRYFAPLKLDQRIAHERLSRLCFVDYDREMVLVVEHQDRVTREFSILGVGRLTKLHEVNEAEFALTVGDQWQGKGIGTTLLKALVQVGRDEKLDGIKATILADNLEMQHVAHRAGFKLAHVPGENRYDASLIL